MLNNFVYYLIYILVLEGCVLGCLIILIILHRIRMGISMRREQRKQEILGKFYLEILEKKIQFDPKNFPGKSSWYKSILVALEAYSSRLMGGQMDLLKKNIVEHYLLNRARRWSTSSRWLRRNFAARSFALYAESIDESRLLQLIEDKKYLVRSPASFALIALESKEGIKKILEAILKESGYAQYIYRDALIRGSLKVLQHLNEFAQDPKYHPIVLDLLGAKTWGGNIPFLPQDLCSQDPHIYGLALRVLLRNHLPDSVPYFKAALSNPSAVIRGMGYQGISLFPSNELCQILEGGLKDSDWDVRVHAGKLLKRQGDVGIQILNNQSDPTAKEAAQFVLKF